VSRSALTTLHIAPLVGILIVLAMYLFGTASFPSVRGMPSIWPPPAHHHWEPSPSVWVRLTAQGYEVRTQAQAIAIEERPGEQDLQSLRRLLSERRREGTFEVSIEAEDGIAFEAVVQVMDCIRGIDGATFAVHWQR
jgi:biopolymer transport protein ExbD